MAAARRQAKRRAMQARRRARAAKIGAPRRRCRAVACAAAVAALGAAGCGSSGSHVTSASSGASASSGRSPACLPTALDRSAKLAGVPLDVSPAPGTDTANPSTQISFLGVPAAEIHDVSVVGGRSGRHAGRLASYSQGDGASYVPDAPFSAGESVVVRAVIGAGKQASRSASASASSARRRRQPSRSTRTRRRRPPNIRASTRYPASRRRS